MGETSQLDYVDGWECVQPPVPFPDGIELRRHEDMLAVVSPAFGSVKVFVGKEPNAKMVRAALADLVYENYNNACLKVRSIVDGFATFSPIVN